MSSRKSRSKSLAGAEESPRTGSSKRSKSHSSGHSLKDSPAVFKASPKKYTKKKQRRTSGQSYDIIDNSRSLVTPSKTQKASSRSQLADRNGLGSRVRAATSRTVDTSTDESSSSEETGNESGSGANHMSHVQNIHNSSSGDSSSSDESEEDEVSMPTEAGAESTATQDSEAAEVQERARYTPDLPAMSLKQQDQVYLEDVLGDDKELWLCHVPHSVDTASLHGKVVLPGGRMVVHSEVTEGGPKYLWEISVQDGDQIAGPVVVLPSKKKKALGSVVKLNGQMCVSMTPQLEPYNLPEAAPRPRVMLPEGLRVRHVPFGADSPQRVKRKKERKHSHAYGSPPKKRKKAAH